MRLMNKYPDHVCEHVESNSVMVLHADLAGVHIMNVLREYSLEINTKEKLRKLLYRMLEEDVEVDEQISEPTL